MTEHAPPADPIAAVTHPDPYPYYARLRAVSALSFDARLNAWVACSAGVVREALAHPQLRVRPASEQVPKAIAGTPLGDTFALLVRMNDGEFHARHKPPLAQALASTRPADVSRIAREVALELAPQMQADRLLSHLPVRVMARLAGIPAEELDPTCDAVNDFVKGIAPNATPRAIDRGQAAATHLMAQGERAGLDKVQSAQRIARMQQSLDATAGLIGNAIVRGCSVDEVLVTDPPLHNTRRWAAADTELAGQRIAAGQGVLLLVASAVQEEGRGDLQFGAGGHACPGQAIACEIARTALATLRERGDVQRLFSRPTGYRPLVNARIPTFD